MTKLLLCLPLLFVGCAGLILEDKTPITSEFVHEIQKPKKEVFSKAIEWTAKNFHRANNVIQLKDEETGKIVVHGTFEAVGKFVQPSNIPFSMNIDIKDGKYRTQFEDLRSFHSSYRQTVIDSFEQLDLELFTFVSDDKTDEW